MCSLKCANVQQITGNNEPLKGVTSIIEMDNTDIIFI